MRAIHGVMSDLVMDDATHYHATFTAADGFEGQGSVTVDAAKFTDAALNANPAATAATVTIDTQNPTVAIEIAASELSDGGASCGGSQADTVARGVSAAAVTTFLACWPQLAAACCWMGRQPAAPAGGGVWANTAPR